MIFSPVYLGLFTVLYNLSRKIMSKNINSRNVKLFSFEVIKFSKAFDSVFSRENYGQICF